MHAVAFDLDLPFTSSMCVCMPYEEEDACCCL